jgi:hypothetical protein
MVNWPVYPLAERWGRGMISSLPQPQKPVPGSGVAGDLSDPTDRAEIGQILARFLHLIDERKAAR